MQELKIGTSWVRGVVGEAMTPELAVDFASAFGTWVDGDGVVIGRDTRKSSPMLRCAVVSGLLACGCEVLDLDVATTPLVSFAVRELGAGGGISITGGHNDSRWNALKFIGPDGALLNPLRGEELLDFYHAKSFRRRPGDRWVTLRDSSAVLDGYLEFLLSSLDVAAIRASKPKLVADFGGGAAGGPARRLAEALGCGLEVAGPRRDGAGFLGRQVVAGGADLGAALSIDGDRIELVTEAGVRLSEEHTLPLAAEGRLPRRAGAVVTNLSTSRMIEAVAARHGRELVRTAVGESHVVAKGIELDASLAGEGSGGVAALPFAMTFDALLTLGLVLELLATREGGLGSLAARLPRLASRKGEIRCPPARAYHAVDAFRSRYAARPANLDDGVRVEWEDAWLHVRVSTTEPLLRVIVEADQGRRADEIFEEARRLAVEALGREGSRDA